MQICGIVAPSRSKPFAVVSGSTKPLLLEGGICCSLMPSAIFDEHCRPPLQAQRTLILSAVGRLACSTTVC